MSELKDPSCGQERNAAVGFCGWRLPGIWVQWTRLVSSSMQYSCKSIIRIPSSVTVLLRLSQERVDNKDRIWSNRYHRIRVQPYICRTKLYVLSFTTQLHLSIILTTFASSGLLPLGTNRPTLGISWRAQSSSSWVVSHVCHISEFDCCKTPRAAMDFSKLNAAEQAHMSKYIEKKQVMSSSSASSQKSLKEY